ncbi:MAG: hypothetical protein ABW065_00760 [Solirubrobacterales bacterium]
MREVRQTHRRSRWFVSIFGVTLLALLPFGSPASAATLGELTPLNCYSTTGVTGCTSQPGLDGQSGLSAGMTASPDGRSVYQLTSKSTLVQFDVAADGSLSYVTCIGDASLGVNNPCPVAAPGFKVGSGGSGDLAVSPDGGNLYAVGPEGDAVAVFRRDTSGPNVGRLTSEGCLANTGTTTCDLVPGTTHGQAPGLDGPWALAISANGANVYVASLAGNAVAVLKRDTSGPALGRLSSDGCLALTGTGLCNAVPGSTHGEAPALEAPDDVALSPDQRNVYVSSVFGAVVVLSRDVTGPTPGRLVADGCLAQTARTVCDAVAGSTKGQAPGISNPQALVVSPDGANVYVAGQAYTAAFKRDTSGPTPGRLVSDGCLAILFTATCDNVAGNTHGRVLGASSSAVVISPDGANVYSVASGEEFVVAFRRDAAGGLVFDGCKTKTGVTSCDAVGGATQGQAPGIMRPSDLAMAPNGGALYVAGNFPGTALAFSRFVPAPPPPPPPPPEPTQPTPETARAADLRIVSATAGRGGRITVVLESSGAGTTRVDASYKARAAVPKGAPRPKKPKFVQRFYGSASVTGASKMALDLRPSAAAKQLLNKGKQLLVTLQATLTPPAGAAVTKATSLRVKLPKPQPRR